MIGYKFRSIDYTEFIIITKKSHVILCFLYEVYILNLYTEHIFRKTNHIPGMKINGHNINNLRYTEDTCPDSRG